MRAIVRGFALFLGSLVVAALVLRATVFDVWTVTDVSRGVAEPSRSGLTPSGATNANAHALTLTKGDVVLVLRDSKPSQGDIARCMGPDGKSAFALRVSPTPAGSSDPNDLPRPARLAAPHSTTPPKRARAGSRSARENVAQREKAPLAEAPASAPTDLASTAKTAETTTCRRVVFRLWGPNGPQDPEHRLTLVD